MGAKAADDKGPSILPLFVAVLLIPAVLGSSKTIFNDGDVSWHIATGQWILDHRAIPHVDPVTLEAKQHRGRILHIDVEIRQFLRER